MSEKTKKQISIIAAVSAAVLVTAAAVLTALFWPRAGEASGNTAAADAWVCPIDKDFNKWQCEEVMKSDPGYISEENSRKLSGLEPGGEGVITSEHTCSGPDANGVVTCDGGPLSDNNFYIGKTVVGGILQWLTICHTYSSGSGHWSYVPAQVAKIVVYGYGGWDRIEVLETTYGLCDGVYLSAFNPAWTTKLEAWGGSNYDTIIGGPNADNLHGENDRDYIYGKGGDDYLYDGNGDDYIYCGSGVDHVMGGWGSDHLYCDPAHGGSGYKYLYGGNGYDYYYTANDGSYMFDVAATPTGNYFHGGNGVDRIWGDDGDDYILAFGGADEIYGLGGDDEIWADDFFGNGANDYIEGGLGDDLIVGGGGSDTIYGDLTKHVPGNGHDCIVGDYLDPEGVPVGDEGSDTIFAGEWSLDEPNCVYCDDAWFYTGWPGSCQAYDSYPGGSSDFASGCLRSTNPECRYDCDGYHGHCELTP